MTARTEAIATASANLLRSLGGSIGTAAFGVVFAPHSVHTVFLAAAIAGPLLEEVPLGGPATVRGA